MYCTSRHSAVVDSQESIIPGETRSLFYAAPRHFRVDEAERVEGIDYEAFTVENVYVGVVPQLRASRPATALFKEIRTLADYPDGVSPKNSDRRPVLDTCKAALSITIVVTNNSDKSLPFAIKLNGLTLVEEAN